MENKRESISRQSLRRFTPWRRNRRIVTAWNGLLYSLRRFKDTYEQRIFPVAAFCPRSLHFPRRPLMFLGDCSGPAKLTGFAFLFGCYTKWLKGGMAKVPIRHMGYFRTEPGSRPWKRDGVRKRVASSSPNGSVEAGCN